MNQTSRLLATYVVGSILALAAVSAVVAKVMIRVIGWYLDNCISEQACKSVSLLIDYWWLIYIPIVVCAGGLIGRDYQTRASRLR